MAIIVPQRYSTFGDSTSTEGPSRKYVLAQFRSDAELAWIGQLRTALATTEVKYKHFLDQRPRLRQDRDLWTQIEQGITAATIIVTDPEPVMANVRRALVADGAEFERDFDESVLQRHTATALIGGTPIAYIPEELMAKLAWARGERLVGLSAFAPSEIQKRIGSSLRNASVLAARAHAIFDTAATDPTLQSTIEVFRSPLSTIIFAELLSTARVFDSEDASSASVLNEASEKIADAMAAVRDKWTITPAPLVSEADSRTIDHLQAADMAAGWARQILETSPPKVLADTFERVWLNGRLLQRNRL